MYQHTSQLVLHVGTLKEKVDSLLQARNTAEFTAEGRWSMLLGLDYDNLLHIVSHWSGCPQLLHQRTEGVWVDSSVSAVNVEAISRLNVVRVRFWYDNARFQTVQVRVRGVRFKFYESRPRLDPNSLGARVQDGGFGTSGG